MPTAGLNNEEKSEIISIKNNSNNLVRSVWYFLGLVLLTFVTVLIFFSLFTNNWQKTIINTNSINEIILNYSEYYTFGVWFTCKIISVKWLGNIDIYCSNINDDLGSWIIAVQVFYTLGASFNLLGLIAAIYGICKDFGNFTKSIPSLIVWFLVFSSVFQLVAISLYAGFGIGDYSKFLPDYSIICSSVALGSNTICVIFFILEIFLNKIENKSEIK